MMKRFSISLFTVIFLLGTPHVGFDHALAETPNTPVNKYQAINILFWYFKIDTNKDYLPPHPLFRQYFKDIWPANPYYAYVNTACEINLFPCRIDAFFDGEANISLPSFLHLFYTLKYRDNPNAFQEKFLSYQGNNKDFTYLQEALQSHLLDPPQDDSTITTNTVFEMLRRDKILSAFDGVVYTYFDGLETDPSQITTEKYYNLEKLMGIIRQYTSILSSQAARLATITDTTQKNILKRKSTFLPLISTPL